MGITAALSAFFLSLTIIYHSYFSPSTTSITLTTPQSLSSSPRQLWSDSIQHDDPAKMHPADATLPSHLRGDRAERVHYMETITPTKDEQWFSACLAPNNDNGDDDQPTMDDDDDDVTRAKKTQRIIPTAAAKKHSRTTKQRKMTTSPSLKHMRRDSTSHQHRYTDQAPLTHSKHVGSLYQPSNIFGFEAPPERDPLLACRYSASFLAENAALCEEQTGDPDSPDSLTEMVPTFKDVNFVLKQGRHLDDPTCGAEGWFSGELLTSGWDYLFIRTNENWPDDGQSRAAGWLEGSLTTQPIWEHHTNEMQVLFGIPPTVDTRTQGWIQDQMTYNLQMVGNYSDTDPYWYQLGQLYQQLHGLYIGYNLAQTDPMKMIPYSDFMYLQLDGDMTDIQTAVGAGTPTPVNMSSSLVDIELFLIRTGHCSALVKVTDNNEELWVAHDTWAGFSSSHRMYKAYHLRLSNTPAETITFSSYPAFLSSTDDWYQTSQQLVVMETTNDIVNQSLYVNVTSSSVSTWARAVIASRLATSGNEWTTYFGYNNSGTYNNQWMVVDMKQFKSGQEIQPNTLWVLEIMPGAVFSIDASSYLAANAHWGSFNRPFFTPVYVAMGYAVLNESYGSYLFGYDDYFRNLMFKRENVNITTLFDMQRVMSLNEWRTDPLSRNNSGFAISSRFDLSGYDPAPVTGDFYRGAWGAYDSKITCYSWNRHPLDESGVEPKYRHNNTLRVSLINGPTHWTQPVFTWNDPEWSNTSHIGLPPSYDFDFLQIHM